jgi:nicotinate-nucleotide pyrophosphorylase (carboxylating)
MLYIRVEWTAQEGEYLNPDGKIAIAHVYGKARHLLLGERIALNIISRCSGIALK